MSNYSALKTDINNNIYENNTQQITGTVLNTVLKDMVNTLGAGYQFAGCAYLDLNPGAPDAKVFYLAGEGLYTNFDNIQVPAGKLGILKWDTRWRLETIEGLGGGGANLTGYISVASTDDLPDVGQPTIGYLCGTNLYLYVGEGGDTKDGKYQNCGGFRGPEGVGITEIEQVEQSTENGGRNTIRIHLSNGSSYDVYTRNGTTSTGLFPTLEALQAAYPSPVVGQYAFVGAGFPADIYVCNTAGTWTDSGADYDGDSVDLTDYATKAELNQLEAEVTDLTDPDYESTGTREVNKADYLDGVTKSVNGVSILCNADGSFEMSGTATSGGGKAEYLTKLFTLPAGNYILRRTKIADGDFPAIYLMSNDRSTALKTFNADEVSFTAVSDIIVYIGANVTNGVTYSGKRKFEVIGTETYAKKTAEDNVARNKLQSLSTYKDISGITDITHHYVNYSTGELVESSGWDAYRFRPVVGSKIKAFVGINLSTWAAIAFYNSATPTTASYLGGVQGIVGSYSYEAIVPDGAVLAIVCNRRATEANPAISAYIESLSEIVKTINTQSSELDKLTGNVEKVFSSFGHSVGRVVDGVYSDMTWVGDKLVCFNSSNDDLQTEPGRIAVYTFGNGKDKPYTDKNFGYHTLGHCNTIDYCEETDCLILGNGSGSYNLSGKIIIIPGFSSLIGNVYSDYPSTNPLGITNSGAIVIDCASYNLGTKFNVLWGESNGLQYNIAYLITAKTGGSTSDPAGGDNGTIRRIVLGMGSNSLQYGQFISGKADDEFNGTFAITDTYTQPETNYTNGCNQGTCYHKGRIISAVNHDGLNIWAMRLDDGKIYRNVYNQKTFGADGTETKNNISGICVKDGRMYVGGVNLGILCYEGIVD